MQNNFGVLARLLVIAGLTLCQPAFGFAHTVGISRGDYRLSGTNVETTLVFARPELAGAVPDLDTNHDGLLSPSEVRSGLAMLERIFVRGLEIRRMSEPCAGSLGNAELTEEEGLSIVANYTCPNSAGNLAFGLKFLSVMSHGHRHLANVTSGDSNTRVVAYAGNSEFQWNIPAERGARDFWINMAGPLFLLGIRHILTGYDHLIFLLGLILIGGRVRSILLVITAFTVAHSITLGMAAMQILTPSTRLVEPAIALSIAYIGVENWVVQNPSRRWMITFPFGLIHGFGFAGALQQISLPHAQIPLALVSFNFGVEAGQLAVLAVILPAVLWMRRREWFANAGVKLISSGIAMAGLCWFFLRIA